MIKRPIIAVWFSCGAASAVAAKLTIEQYSENYEILIVNNPVHEEHEDNLRFLKDVQQWLGVEILSILKPELQAQLKYGIGGNTCQIDLALPARKF